MREIVGLAVEQPTVERVALAGRILRLVHRLPILDCGGSRLGTVAGIEQDGVLHRQRNPFGDDGQVGRHRSGEVIRLTVDGPPVEHVALTGRVSRLGCHGTVRDGLRWNGRTVRSVETNGVRGGLFLLPAGGQRDITSDRRAEIVGFAVQQPTKEHVSITDGYLRLCGRFTIGDRLGGKLRSPIGVERDRMIDRCLHPFGGQGDVIGDRCAEIVRLTVKQPSGELISLESRHIRFRGLVSIGDILGRHRRALASVEGDHMNCGSGFLPLGGQRDIRSDRGREIIWFPILKPAGEHISVLGWGFRLIHGVAIGDGLRVDWRAAIGVERDGMLRFHPIRNQSEILGDRLREIIWRAVQQPVGELVSVTGRGFRLVHGITVGDGYGCDRFPVT